jgi:hypothetical protein
MQDNKGEESDLAGAGGYVHRILPKQVVDSKDSSDLLMCPRGRCIVHADSPVICLEPSRYRGWGYPGPPFFRFADLEDANPIWALRASQILTCDYPPSCSDSKPLGNLPKATVLRVSRFSAA